MIYKNLLILTSLIMFSLFEKVDAKYDKLFFDFSIKGLNNETLNLSEFKGKTILLVNVASKCGFTKQYTGLQTLYDNYKDKDFSLLIKLEHAISPYVAFIIMPIFAFANAGVSLEGLSLSSLLQPVPLGILLGLFVGKQVGVMIFSFIAVKSGAAQMPDNSSWLSLYGVSVLTGIGFTMSLFVGNLAFAENTQYIDGVKIGVLAGSLLSTLLGYFILLFSTKK